MLQRILPECNDLRALDSKKIIIYVYPYKFRKEIMMALNDLENLFLGLADRTRLRLLNLIRNDEVCVWYFTEVLKESQPKISRHLAYLRNAGVVSARRQGKWIFYRITPRDDHAERILLDVIDAFDADPGFRREYEALLQSYADTAAV